MKQISSVAIVNSQASRVSKQLDELKLLLKSEFNDIKIIEVSKPKDLKKRTKDALSQKPKKIIVVGGDGSILTVLKVAHEIGLKSPIGIIPLGTANYLARNLGYDLTLEDAIKRIKKGTTKTLYLPKVNGEFFTLMLTVGVTTAISENIEVRFKQRFGQFAYIFEAFRQLAKKDAFEYKVNVDKARELTGRTHQIIVANADLNKQLHVVPGSKIHSRSVRLSVYENNSSKLRFIFMVLGYIITLGRYKKGLRTVTAQKLSIKTSPKQTVAVDGEPILTTPLEVEIKNTKVQLLG